MKEFFTEFGKQGEPGWKSSFLGGEKCLENWTSLFSSGRLSQEPIMEETGQGTF